MSTDVPVRTSLSSGFRLEPAEVVITRRLLNEMWKITRWFWPIAIGVTVIVATVISSVNPITSSVWEYAGQWPRWWLFSMAIALVVTTLPLVVLHGVTRRSAIRSVGYTSVLISLSWGGFMVSGHVVEKFTFDRLGWTSTSETPHLFSDGYDVFPMLAEYSMIFLAYITSGVLIGALYYRLGGIRGTLLLPPALLPAATMEVLLSTSWVGSGLQGELSMARPTAAVLTAVALAVLSLSALAIHVVLRDAPIHGTK